MNYIHRLQSEIEELKAEKAEAHEQIEELVSYLSSDKFRCGDELDGYVNIQDVLPRLLKTRLAVLG